jgi:hypothetical protein
MNDSEFLDLTMKVGIILLKHIESLGEYDELLITYGEVARRLPDNFNPRNLDMPLGTLSGWCEELGLPLISTIVVNQGTLMPGAGYFKEFFPSAKEQQWPEIFVREFNRVKECRDWTLLAVELGHHN